MKRCADTDRAAPGSSWIPCRVKAYSAGACLLLDRNEGSSEAGAIMASPRGGGCMAISELLLLEFDEEMKKTRTTLERVPVDKPDFAPHPKSMPLGKLAPHV